MTLAQTIALNPTAFRATLEGRVAELSDLVRATTVELAMLTTELRFLRTGHKSALEVKVALMARETSL